MRPVPKSQHRMAALILLAVALIYTLLAMSDYRMSDSQLNIGTSAIKLHDPASFQYDAIYGRPDTWKSNIPAASALEIVLAPTGYGDIVMPFRLMTGVLTMIFLMGMYSLLYRQCGSWGISTFVAILSSTIVYTLGQSYWGAGSLGSTTPWTLCNSLIPWLVLAFLHYLDRWRMLLAVFAGVGLIGNIHPVVAMNLAIVLLIVYLGHRRFAPLACLTAGLFGLVAIAAAMPYVGYLLSIRAVGSEGSASLSLYAVQQAFQLTEWSVLYPDVLKNILNWILLVIVVLVIPAAVVISRIERYRVRDLNTWIWFICVALTVCLGFHGASQFIGWLAGRTPPVIDFVQAASLIMLPLYVLLAQAITNISRLARTHRGLVWTGCAILMASWMFPSDNLRVARYYILDQATAFIPEADKPRSVQRHHESAERNRELRAMAQYARYNTGKDAVFITNEMEFRMFSWRSLMAAPNDAKQLYYMAPNRLEGWLKRLEMQETLLRHSQQGRTDGSAVVRYVNILKDGEFKGASEWYVILDAGEAPDNPAPLKQITSDNWGKYFCLYKLP